MNKVLGFVSPKKKIIPEPETLSESLSRECEKYEQCKAPKPKSSSKNSTIPLKITNSDQYDPEKSIQIASPQTMNIFNYLAFTSRHPQKINCPHCRCENVHTKLKYEFSIGTYSVLTFLTIILICCFYIMLKILSRQKNAELIAAIFGFVIVFDAMALVYGCFSGRFKDVLHFCEECDLLVGRSKMDANLYKALMMLRRFDDQNLKILLDEQLAVYEAKRNISTKSKDNLLKTQKSSKNSNKNSSSNLNSDKISDLKRTLSNKDVLSNQKSKDSVPKIEQSKSVLGNFGDISDNKTSKKSKKSSSNSNNIIEETANKLKQESSSSSGISNLTLASLAKNRSKLEKEQLISSESQSPKLSLLANRFQNPTSDDSRDSLENSGLARTRNRNNNTNSNSVSSTPGRDKSPFRSIADLDTGNNTEKESNLSKRKITKIQVPTAIKPEKDNKLKSLQVGEAFQFRKRKISESEDSPTINKQASSSSAWANKWASSFKNEGDDSSKDSVGNNQNNNNNNVEKETMHGVIKLRFILLNLEPKPKIRAKQKVQTAQQQHKKYT